MHAIENSQLLVMTPKGITDTTGEIDYVIERRGG
jgi:hypothetical protein